MQTTGYLSELFVSYQGEGAHVGRRHLFVRMAGCNLRCRYCDTSYALERPRGFQVYDPERGVRELNNPVSTAELVPILSSLAGAARYVDAVVVTGGEPLVQAEFVAELLSDGRLSCKRLLETNGSLPERLAITVPCVDIVSMDIKLPSNTGGPGLWDEHARSLSMVKEKAYVKLLVNDTTDPDEVVQAADIVATTAPSAAIFLQPITSPDGRVTLSPQRLDLFFNNARRCSRDVRVLPQVHPILGGEFG